MTTRLIIGIESCLKYADKCEMVRRTWLPSCQKAGVKAFFFVGRPGTKPELMGDTVYLDCGDGYLDLPQKTIAFFKFVREHFDFDFIYKCDDDTYVNLPVLLKLNFKPFDYAGNGCQLKNMRGDVGWHHKHVQPHLQKPYPGVNRGSWMIGGCGYFLSHASVDHAIKDYPQFIDVEFYEDKLIGDIMRSRGVAGKVFLELKQGFLLRRQLLIKFSRVFFYPFASLHPLSIRQMEWVHHNVMGTSNHG